MPARRVRRAREHEVDDVLGVVVLAVGDEDLVAGDQVAAIGLRTAFVRTAARSEPACGSVRFIVPVHSPATIFGRYVCLSASRAVELDRFDRPAGEHRAEPERHVRRVPHLVDRGGHELRHPLAAEISAFREAVPAELAELSVCVAESGRRRHAAVGLETRALLVPDAVQRIENSGGELVGFLEDRGDGFGCGILESRQLRDLARGPRARS